MNPLNFMPFMLCVVYGAPKLRVYPQQTRPQLLTLPSNATSIRADITDSFSCESREYGYYADIENDCQIFHVCLPVKYSDGRNQTFRWSFICPDEMVFNQELFTCTHQEDSINCLESPRYYDLNVNFGDVQETETEEPDQVEDEVFVPDVRQAVDQPGRRHASLDTKKKSIEY